MTRWILPYALAASLLCIGPLRADPKPAKVEDRPKIVVATPPSVVAGASAKVILRGRKLDNITEVRCPSAKVTVKLLTKSAGGDIPRVGKTQAEIDIAVPADFAESTVTLTVVNPAGESNAYRLIVDKSAVVREKEPNNGFLQSQQIAVGQIVAGAIDRGFDVDVYRFDGKAGQKITAEIFAARLGSPLDSILTLYTGEGQTIVANDDMDSTTTDSRLEATLPKDGAYYLVVVDANDRGSVAHVYRLELQARP